MAATTAVADLLQIFSVVPLDTPDFQRALAIGFRDCEDAVQLAACLKAGVDFLVTQIPKDFKGAPVTLHSAGDMLGILAGRRPQAR